MRIVKPASIAARPLNQDEAGKPHRSVCRGGATMPQQPSSVQHRLQDLARRLREADHLDPEAQQLLADLVAELSETLRPEQLSSGETAHLADSAAQLARAIEQGRDLNVLRAAKNRLEAAVISAEARAPLVVGVVRRLIDALASIGI
jgi:hypothetical protein